MTMNQGLFDIQVDVGTTDGNGIVHTGEDAAARPEPQIYMVAVPKNQALTMLLGGTVGFDVNSVLFDQGQIILSAGQGVRHDLRQRLAGWSDRRTAGGDHHQRRHLHFERQRRSTGTIDASGGGGSLSFAGNVTLQALDEANSDRPRRRDCERRRQRAGQRRRFPFVQHQ